MPLTFPTGVADGYVHTDGDRSWKYNDTYNAWEELSQPSPHTHPLADLTGVTPADIGAVQSNITGIAGADAITNVVSLTQAEYDAIGTPDASTLYVITS